MSTEVDAPSLSISSGLRIGRYVLGRKLGRGGFGVVYRAHDTSLDREVALKFLHAEHTATPQMLERFLQEARSAARIAHAGIVTVYECGQVQGTGTPADGSAYIAMELLQGESLTDRLARTGRLDPAAAMEITRQVASALEAAHRAGIVHRDLKPDNIFLVPDSAVATGERAKILDFGIAKLGRTSIGGVETQSMQVFGTPRYMSPEQCRSAAHLDHRSDIYSLGCILFELVCGRPPFAGAPGELIAQHVLVPAPAADSIEPSLSPALSDLIEELLAKEPTERPQTMAAVQRALEKAGAWAPGVAPTLLPDQIASQPIALPPPASRRMRAANPTTLHAATGVSVVVPSTKRRAPWIAGIAAGIAIVGALVLVLALRHGGEPDPRSPLPAADQPKPSPTQATNPESPPPRPASEPKTTIEPAIEPNPATSAVERPAIRPAIKGTAPTPVGQSSKAQPPKPQPPKPQPPKPQPPKAEPPKTQPPRTDPPKSEPPKIEPPRTEPPKTEPPNTKPRDKTINPFAKKPAEQ